MRAYKAEWATAEAVVVNADTDDAVSAGLIALQVSANYYALLQLLAVQLPMLASVSPTPCSCGAYIVRATQSLCTAVCAIMICQYT
jgi:hypothetical protein